MAKGARKPQDGAGSAYSFLARTLDDLSRGLKEAHQLYWNDVNGLQAEDGPKPHAKAEGVA